MRTLPIVLALLLAPPPLLASPASRFGDAFWKHWGDGRAEIATYDLTYPRYGEERQGTAVTIFVTETFSDAARVKADPGVHPRSDEFPVMKLNLVQDFPTGIYDYNLMTSAFVALTARFGRPEGSPAKVTFSSQEWCGHVFHEVLPREHRIDYQLHSYFDGEADQSATLEYPESGILEDVLFHWARGFAAPFLEPGRTREVSVLRSAEIARLRHLPVEWERATLSRSATTREVDVPAGSFTAETFAVHLEGGRSWEFLVEKEPPRRIVRWSTGDGKRAELVASQRIPYWKMNAARFEGSLADLGLKPRPPRTP